MAYDNYCDYALSLPLDNPHRRYHDRQYGRAIEVDDELFGLLLLEINQAGLSWNTILKKQDNFRNAYANFSIEKVTAFAQADIDRLLADAGIIRNRLKIKAAITNAQKILVLQQQFGSFKAWLESNRGKSRDEWTRLFKQTFVFTGGEIVNEFLMSCGYLPGAHMPDCPILAKIKQTR
ncbi:MAG: DNA-3-methyladenine glycosylase I [Candidatus Falkowbacteria bacterium]